MSTNSTTSAFSMNLLATIYSAFSSDISYSSFYYSPSNTTIPLVTFIGNPNFSGLGYDLTDASLSTIYDGLINCLYNFRDDVSSNSVTNYNFGTVKGFRITVVLANGTVFFDSYNSSASDPSMNTYANFLNQSILNNHGTRKHIQEAHHSKSGIGYETCWSSTTKGLQSYYAVRYGESSTGIIGDILFSYSNSY
jgi:hypothetical protein